VNVVRTTVGQDELLPTPNQHTVCRLGNGKPLHFICTTQESTTRQVNVIRLGKARGNWKWSLGLSKI
jgi:hypothetical protein